MVPNGIIAFKGPPCLADWESPEKGSRVKAFSVSLIASYTVLRQSSTSLALGDNPSGAALHVRPISTPFQIYPPFPSAPAIPL